MALTRKNLRASNAEVRKPKKPRCKEHEIEMVYDPIRNVWTCPRAECKMIAHPPDEIGGRKPVSFSGQFELLVVKQPNDGSIMHVVIRKDKVMFDVSEHLLSLFEDTGAMHLSFSDVLIVDPEGNPMK